MSDFFDRIILNNSVGDYLTAVLVILGMYMLKKYLAADGRHYHLFFTADRR